MSSVRFKLDDDIDNLYRKVVDPGFTGKFNEAALMGLQVLEAIYYALEVFLLTQGANAFYAYPGSDKSNSDLIPLETIITDEDSFVCNGTTYFRNNTGPLANYTFSSDSDLGMVRGLPAYFFFAIFAVVAFTLTRIYMGKYNMLFKLVKFKKDKDGIPKPFEFGLFFTIACNASKWMDLSFVDVCGRRAFFSEHLSPDTAQYFMVLIYTLIILLLILWLMFWTISCGLMTFCNGKKQFKWIRRSLLVASVITTVIWAINFDPKLAFDIKMPRIFALNVVSFFDLGTSILGEIYLSFPGPFQACCCSDRLLEAAGDFHGNGAVNDDLEEDENGGFQGDSVSNNSVESGFELNSLDGSKDDTAEDSGDYDEDVSDEFDEL